MMKQNSVPMPLSSLSPELTLDCSQLHEDDIDKKRRQLLIRSAKRPLKRSRFQKHQCHREPNSENEIATTISTSSSSSSSSSRTTNSSLSHKRESPRKRRMVSFDAKYNITTSVPSHKDLSESERRSYFLQRDEYMGIKRNIQQTLEFLKAPTDVSLSSGATSCSESTSDEHCVRGLEYLAEEFVNKHKRRVQKSSKKAVFRFQRHRRRKIREARAMMESNNGDMKTTEETLDASLALAEVYKKCTSQCEDIARRWGHFDAIDAGIDPVSSASATAVSFDTTSSLNKEEPVVDNIIVEAPVDNNGSLSSLSYDGDDGEDEEENESITDFNLPHVTDQQVEKFDSLPNVLLNF